MEARIRTGDASVRAATADADGTESHCDDDDDDDDAGDGEWSQMSAKLRTMAYERIERENIGC